jgi:hypothetical protein
MDSAERDFSPGEFRRYSRAIMALAQLVGKREVCWQQIRFWYDELEATDRRIRQHEQALRESDLESQLAAILGQEESA